MEKINDRLEQSKASAKLVTTELPQSWIMWTYLEAYQNDGFDWGTL